jgi:hypothetical protein
LSATVKELCALCDFGRRSGELKGGIVGLTNGDRVQSWWDSLLRQTDAKLQLKPLQ